MIQKQAVTFNFSQGIDTKTDPYQVPFGKFLSLVNTVYDKGGRLSKRNGFGQIASLTKSKFLTTFNGNLVGIGSQIQALSSGSGTASNKGSFQPITLSTLPTVRSALSQVQCDSVVAPNGLVCAAYTEINNTTPTYRYTIQDSTTGQNIVNPTTITVTSGAVTGSPRVFLLGQYFIVMFTNTITGTAHLQYIAIPIASPSSPTANIDLVSAYTPPGSGTNLNWDGIVVPGTNRLYVAYNSTSGGQHIGVTYLTTGLNSSFITPPTPTNFSGSISTIIGMGMDTTVPGSPVIYVSFYDGAGNTGYVVALDQNIAKLMTATQIISSGTIYNITCSAISGVVTVFYEVSSQYGYDSAISSNYIKSVPVTLPATVTTGSVGSTTTPARSVGLASKAFTLSGTNYVLTEYASALQSTYFLINSSGSVLSRFAYENGGASASAINSPYLPYGLPQAQVSGSTANIAYLYKDLISTTAPVSNVTIGATSVTNVYSQTGANMASLNFGTNTLSVSEIGANLNISGGMLWSYDGQTINEQGFNLFPDYIEGTWSSSGGNMAAKPDGATNTNAYYYQVIYQWTDAQGNIIRSAPSVPIPITTSGAGTTGSVALNIPTLRLTYKSNVKIVIFRWSVANQVYYQTTSLTAPTLNDPTVDYITYTDAHADTAIVGNEIIYTTGGVIEDIPAPAATATTLFDDRLWIIDAEDQNLLWYSKQVIESTPVEMSDLLTIYVAPTIGAQGSTGKLRCLGPMDDKLILFKQDAMYYINGTGPDNTGANNQYSQPIFINSTVGCSNQNSIVFMPNGLMFQSDKGIWLLGRDLSTSYIGAPVEAYNSYTVTSAQNIPATNQVRFTLSNGVILAYDYFYGEWSTFQGASASSSTIYQGLHTIINSSGVVSQETPNAYLDNGNPVLMSFLSSWINLASLQGYQRFYDFYLLASFLSPHNLNVTVSYDYNSSNLHCEQIRPQNFSSSTPSPFGIVVPFGAEAPLEQWRIHAKQQLCQSFQIGIQEEFNATYGAPAGAGFTMSGITCEVGIKKGTRPVRAASTAGLGS